MVLIYQLEARERGRHYLRFGLNLETDIGDEANYNLGVNHVWFPINSWDGELRTEGQIGDTMSFGTELYQPIDPREWLFAMPFVNYEQPRRRRLRGPAIASPASTVEQTLSGMYVGVNLGNFAQLRGGIGYLNGEARPQDRRSDRLPPRDALRRGLRARRSSTTRSTTCASRTTGAMRRVESFFFRKELGFDESFERVERGRDRRFAPGARTRSGSGSGTTPRSTCGTGLEAAHSLGGFLNHSGFDRNSLVGRARGPRAAASPTGGSPRRRCSPGSSPCTSGGCSRSATPGTTATTSTNDMLLSARSVRRRRHAARSALPRLRLRRGRRAPGLSLPRPELLRR